MNSQIGVFLVLALLGAAYYIWELRKELASKTNECETLKEENAKLKKYALRDPLTRLGNRRACSIDLRTFDKLFAVKGRENRRKGISLSGLGMMMIDLDDFKRINDTLGHDAGDIVLKRVGKRIFHSLARANDRAYRMGGEEFLVILPDVSDDKLLVLAQELCDTIAELSFGLYQPGTREEVRVTASIGVTFVDNHFDQKQVLKSADIAMYAAKNSGKNKVVHSRDVQHVG